MVFLSEPTNYGISTSRPWPKFKSPSGYLQGSTWTVRDTVIDNGSWRMQASREGSRRLYDMLYIQELELPSRVVKWIPNNNRAFGNDEHLLIVGTQAPDGDRNYLQVCSVYMPKGEDDAAEEEPSQYVRVQQSINHQGKVNQIALNLFNPRFVATQTCIGDALLFNWPKCPSPPPADGVCRPLARLRGHTKEGYGLIWSPLDEGVLLSGSHDGDICMWDVAAKTASGASAICWAPDTQIWPIQRVSKPHGGHAVTDVSFQPLNTKVFASVGHDGRLCAWDRRVGVVAPVDSTVCTWQRTDDPATVAAYGSLRPAAKRKAGTFRGPAEALCVRFSPGSGSVIATAGEDRNINIWDIRRLKNAVHSLEGHSEDVMALEWSVDGSVLASSGLDGKVLLWDPAQIGRPIKGEPAKRPPSELMFMHPGHEAAVLGISWAPTVKGLIASSDQQGDLHVWQMSEDLQQKYRGLPR